jgi:hypothetical protein
LELERERPLNADCVANGAREDGPEQRIETDGVVQVVAGAEADERANDRRGGNDLVRLAVRVDDLRIVSETMRPPLP